MLNLVIYCWKLSNKVGGFMRFIIFALTIYVFIETVSYGIFEQKENKNKVGAIVIYILSFVSLIVPNLVIYFR